MAHFFVTVALRPRLRGLEGGRPQVAHPIIHLLFAFTLVTVNSEIARIFAELLPLVLDLCSLCALSRRRCVPCGEFRCTTYNMVNEPHSGPFSHPMEGAAKEERRNGGRMCDGQSSHRQTCWR